MITRLLSSLLLFFLLRTPELSAAQKTLNLYLWYEEIPEEIFQEFEKETGIKVFVDYYDSNEVPEAKLLTGQTGYDIVMPSAYPYLARQIPAGIYQALDRSKLKNYKNIDPILLERMRKADPENLYGIPYLSGLTGFGYNVEKVKKYAPEAPLDSWGMFFDPDVISKLSSCGVSLLEEPAEVFIPAYLYLGLDPNSQSKEDLEKVTKLLMKIRPYIRRFDSARADSELADGEVCLAEYYVGSLRVTWERRRKNRPKEDLKFVIPKEGGILWMDTFAIPLKAPHPEAAHRFIDFMLRPDIAARVTNFSGFSTSVKASHVLVREDLRQDSLVFPSDAALKKAYLNEPKSAKFSRLLNRTLTKIRTGR